LADIAWLPSETQTPRTKGAWTVLRAALAAVVFLAVIAVPTPLHAATAVVESLDHSEQMLMTLPAVAIILLHHVHHYARRNYRSTRS